MASGTATVKAVISGDTVVLVGAPRPNGPPPELVLTLASLQAPRLARSSEQINEPWAWASREYLRKQLIGKTVRFKVEYRVASINRDFGSIWYKKTDSKEENACVAVARAGYAKVKTDSRDANACGDLDLMQQMEALAISEKRGMYQEPNEKTSAAASASVKWSGEAGEALLDEYKGKLVKAIVESVRDGSWMRVILKPSMQIVNFALAGVQCPRMAPPMSSSSSNSAGTSEGTISPPPAPVAEGPAPFAREAKHFTEMRLLHRDVELKLEGVDKYGNLYGSVVHSSGKNISVELLKNGLAKMSDWSGAFSSNAARSAMRAAEKEAKSSNLRVWRDYQAPVLQSDKHLLGTVVEVVSGDCVIVYVSKKQEEQRIYLSSLRAPRLGNPRRNEPNAPWSTESKEFLRQKAIGKSVRVEVEYEKSNPALGDNALMTFGSVMLENANKKGTYSTNLAVEVVAAGLAEVVRHRPDEAKSEHYDDLVTAENKARTTKKGMHSNKTSVTELRFTDLCFDATKAKQYLPFLTREKKTKATVEYVYSGTRVKLFIPKENCMINFVIAGIKSPAPTRYSGAGVVAAQAEPFGEEAKMFTKRSIMQRDVLVEIEDMDRGGNAFGPLFVGGVKDEQHNFGCHLLQEGLAWVDEYSAERTSSGAQLKRAEEVAKNANKNYWKTHDASLSTTKQSTSVQKDKDDVLGRVKVSEIVSGTHFFLQNVADGVCATVEAQMKEFTRANGVEGKSFEMRKNVVCAALFKDESGMIWNRARIEQVLPDGNVRVRFVDYGNSGVVSAKQMRPLDGKLISYPPQAKECVLGFIKPSQPTEEFGQDAAYMLNEHAWGKVLSARVHGTDENNRLCVSLFTQANQNISEILLESGIVRIDRKSMVHAPKHQKPVVDALIAAQANAKRKRVCLWRYGDIESDEESGF